MKLSLGTVQLGLNYGIANKTGKPNTSEAIRILETAYENGIDTFDTAAGYGNSERLIGDFIREHSLNEKINISTKMAPFKKDVDFSVFLKENLEKSLKNLNIDYADYYLFHSAKDFIENPEVLEAISEFKSTGKIKKFGVSVYSSEEIERCLEIGGIDIIQLPFNILDTRLITSGCLHMLKQKNIEIHARSIYLQGLILMPPSEIPKGLSSVLPYLTELNNLAKGHDMSVKELAFAYVRDHKLIDKLVIGCESVCQVINNIALYHASNKAEDIENEVLSKFSDVSEKILNPALWGI